jgi:hypothetical protein
MYILTWTRLSVLRRIAARDPLGPEPSDRRDRRRPIDATDAVRSTRKNTLQKLLLRTSIEAKTSLNAATLSRARC